jgi:ribokinase
MSAPRIVVVGSSNTDMVVKAKRIPGVGETVTGGSFVMAAGGKGANQAVAAARLGAEVTLVAKVGRDMFGDRAIEGYRAEGIATDCILRDAASPDYS